MWAEYKAFLLRANLIELATAFILGVAFNAVVTAFAEGFIVTPVSEAMGFDEVAEMTVGPFAVGPFLAALLSFIALATVLFFLIRAASRLSRPPAEDTAMPDSEEVLLLREIRDALHADR